MINQDSSFEWITMNKIIPNSISQNEINENSLENLIIIVNKICSKFGVEEEFLIDTQKIQSVEKNTHFVKIINKIREISRNKKLDFRKLKPNSLSNSQQTSENTEKQEKQENSSINQISKSDFQKIFTYTQFDEQGNAKNIQTLEYSFAKLSDCILKSEILHESNISHKIHLQSKIYEALLVKQQKLPIKILFSRNHTFNKKKGIIFISNKGFTMNIKSKKGKNQVKEFSYEKDTHFFLSQTKLNEVFITINSKNAFLIEMKNPRQRDILVNLYLLFSRSEIIQKLIQTHNEKINENDLLFVKSSTHSDLPTITKALNQQSYLRKGVSTDQKYTSKYDYDKEQNNSQENLSFLPLSFNYKMECTSSDSCSFYPKIIDSFGEQIEPKIQIVLDSDHFEIVFSTEFILKRRYSVYSHIESCFPGDTNIRFQFDEFYYNKRKHASPFLKQWFSHKKHNKIAKCSIQTNEGKIKPCSIIISPDIFSIIIDLPPQEPNSKKQSQKSTKRIYNFQYLRSMKFKVHSKNEQYLFVKLSHDFFIILIFASKIQVDEIREILKQNQTNFRLFSSCQNTFISRIRKTSNKFAATLTQDGSNIGKQTIILNEDFLLVLNNNGIFSRYYLFNREELENEYTDSKIKIKFSNMGIQTEIQFTFLNWKTKHQFIRALKIFDSKYNAHQMMENYPHIMKNEDFFPVQITLQYQTTSVKGILKINPLQRTISILLSQENRERDFFISQINPLIEFNRNIEIYFTHDNEKIFLQFDSEFERRLFLKKFHKLKKHFSSSNPIHQLQNANLNDIVDFTIQLKLPQNFKNNLNYFLFQQIPDPYLPIKLFQIHPFDPEKIAVLDTILHVILVGSIIGILDSDTQHKRIIELNKNFVLNSNFSDQNPSFLELLNSGQTHYFAFSDSQEKQMFIKILQNVQKKLQFDNFEVLFVSQNQIILPMNLKLEPTYIHYQFHRQQRKIIYQALEVIVPFYENDSFMLKFFSENYQHEINIKCQNSRQKRTIIQRIIDKKNQKTNLYLELFNEFSTQFKAFLLPIAQNNEQTQKLKFPGSFSVEIFSNISLSQKYQAIIELQESFGTISYHQFPNSYFEFFYSGNELFFDHLKNPKILKLRLKKPNFAREFILLFNRKSHKHMFIQHFAEIYRLKNFVYDSGNQYKNDQETEENFFSESNEDKSKIEKFVQNHSINEVLNIEEDENEPDLDPDELEKEQEMEDLETMAKNQENELENEKNGNDQETNPHNKVFSTNFITKNYKICGIVVCDAQNVINCKVGSKIVKTFRILNPFLFIVQKEKIVIIRDDKTRISFQFLERQDLIRFVDHFNQVRNNFHLVKILQSSIPIKISNKIFISSDLNCLIISTSIEEIVFSYEKIDFVFSPTKPLLKLILDQKEEVFCQFQSSLVMKEFREKLERDLNIK
ncbi:hypothetical protein M0811_04748 [Anaeramoeba ignava]|uniref:Uncharacterized protein n=1 Tax=Anaeramoeba ignava TaxID=1746090 RepID=A0A9Q0LSY6_ANAIG|nr:hypothetical protein M0811_04748 [Anaeramoeba ignava]